MQGGLEYDSAFHAEQDCTELSWLLNLFERKAIDLPRLRMARAMKLCDCDEDEKHNDGLSQEPPSTVRNAALEPGIDLEFSVCTSPRDIESWNKYMRVTSGKVCIVISKCE